MAKISLWNGRQYIALVTAAGSDSPTASVRVNGLRSTPVFARTSTGVYTVTASGVFTLGRTRIFPLDTTGFTAIITHTDVNTITIETFDTNGNPVDGVLSNHIFEVTVFA